MVILEEGTGEEAGGEGGVPNHLTPARRGDRGKPGGTPPGQRPALAFARIPPPGHRPGTRPVASTPSGFCFRSRPPFRDPSGFWFRFVHPLPVPLSRGTGGRWSDRAKAAYKSWRDYILAVKGKIRLRVTLSTQSVDGISTNLVDFVEWRFVMWRCP